MAFLTPSSGHAVNELHVAKDIITPDRMTAHWLYRWMCCHLVKPHKRSQRIIYVKGTRYAERRKWTRRNQVIYEESEDRHIGQPCVHIEERITGERQVGKAAWNLAAFSPEEFMNNRLLFFRIDYEQLSRLLPDPRYSNRRSRKRHSARGKKIASRISMEAGDKTRSAQTVKSHLQMKWSKLTPKQRRLKLRKVLVPVDPPFNSTSRASLRADAPSPCRSSTRVRAPRGLCRVSRSKAKRIPVGTL
jgi:hypothetical protein